MHQRLGPRSRLRVESRERNALLVSLLLILLAAPTVHAQIHTEELHSDRQDGAFVIANPEYDPDLAVAIWAENWSQFPPYEARLFCSYSHDAGQSWSERMLFFMNSRGIYATALPSGFSGYSMDALMDDSGVVHLALVFGIWGGTELPGDTWSEVRYGKLDYVNAVLYDQYLLAEDSMDQDNPSYSRIALCEGREVPGGGGERYMHMLFGYDPSADFDDGQMMYARSSDRGLTWTTPKDVNKFDSLDSPAPCDMVADENGNLYIAYGPSWFSP